MTPQERINPKIINGSRRLRIAKGSGHEVSTVNRLLDRFTAAQKAMKQLRQGGAGMAGMAGMGPGAGLPPGLAPGGSGSMGVRPGRAQERPAKKSRSGNPAKRAQEERG